MARVQQEVKGRHKVLYAEDEEGGTGFCSWEKAVWRRQQRTWHSSGGKAHGSRSSRNDQAMESSGKTVQETHRKMVVCLYCGGARAMLRLTLSPSSQNPVAEQHKWPWWPGCRGRHSSVRRERGKVSSLSSPSKVLPQTRTIPMPLESGSAPYL